MRAAALGVVAGALAALVLCGGVARADGGAADPGVSALLSRVSEAELRGHVEILAGERDAPLVAGARRIRSRSIFHADIGQAEAYLAERLEALGYAVRRLPFTYAPQPTLALANIEATLRGTDAPDEIYVLGAHYDSTAKNMAGWVPASDPAPGADDDASGCALVLEAARLFKGARLRATVRFLLFSAEEVGLVGSADYARAAKAAGDDIRLMISMDPVGNGGPLKDNLFFTYDTASRSQADEIHAIGSRYGIGFPILIVPGDSPTIPDDRSDHSSFWDQGYLGLHGGSLPGDVYHTPGDTPAKVDFRFVAEATKAVVARIAELAGYRPAPASGGCAAAPGGSSSPGPGAALMLAMIVLVAGMVRRRLQQPR